MGLGSWLIVAKVRGCIIKQKCSCELRIFAHYQVMQQIHTPEQIEQMASQHGIHLKDVYSRAGVHRSTPERWGNKFCEPRLSTLRKLSSALNDLISERHRRADFIAQ
jgi:hypothetical protein